MKIPSSTFSCNDFLNRNHLFLPSQHEWKVQRVWLLKAVFNSPRFSRCRKDKKEKRSAVLQCHCSCWIGLPCRSPSCPFYWYGNTLSVKFEKCGPCNSELCWLLTEAGSDKLGLLWSAVWSQGAEYLFSNTGKVWLQIQVVSSKAGADTKKGKWIIWINTSCSISWKFNESDPLSS